MKKINWTILSAAALLFLVACSPASAAAPKTVAITKQNAGQTIEMHPGDQISITLEGNPTTGFTWEAQPPVDEKVLKQAGEPDFKAQSNLTGSGGTITLTFQAIDPGQADISLAYHRPWETNVPPIETFKVTVKVAP